MGFFDRFRNKIRESGTALVEKRTNVSLAVVETTDYSELVKRFQNYRLAYRNIPLVSAIVDVQVDQTVQQFYFEGPNKEKLTEWANKVNLMDFFHKISQSMFIYGNGYVEIIKEGDEITELKVLNSIWMKVYRTQTGDVIGYAQIIENKNKILWGSTGSKSENMKFEKWLPGKLETIVHFKHNVLGSDKYGESIIQPMADALVYKLDMEKNLSKVLFKYVAPLIWAKVGTDEMPANETAVSDIADTLRDLSAESELTTSHLVDLKVLDFNAKGMDIKTPIDQIEQQIITGGQVPPVLLGRSADSDKGTAEVQLRNFGRHIKSNQRELAISFEDNIIINQELGSEEDKIIWNAAEEREWEMDTDIIRGLVTDGIITPQKANDLLPPKYRESLPDPVELAAKMAAATGQNQGPPGEAGPRPTQRKDKKVKDNPNDPTKTTKNKKSQGKRITKTDKFEK